MLRIRIGAENGRLQQPHNKRKQFEFKQNKFGMKSLKKKEKFII